ncbi:SRPBCC family protein [Jeongeupia naejangsanensis]|uniref:SRPBCC family protein n=1 Tax=Jeongeupia naejangsanensis TaxID=613195 RepID=A0ABS2BHU8_9NEIS|nr:SRPBCC family protein [Jeongeupia naejangsanensis]MBM3115179.1 SRPBCC family protein [Jeongeupia naejangsanensis]
MWTHEHSIDASVPAERVWPLFTNTGQWPRWNAGVAAIELHGPFADGSTFTMTLPDGAQLTSTLRDVHPNRSFSDETTVDGTLVVVIHSLDPLPGGGTRIRYATEITGPAAADIGQAVTADFPDVLAALKQLAESGAYRTHE